MNKRDIVESIRYAMYSCIPDHDEAEHLTGVIFVHLQREIPVIVRDSLIFAGVNDTSVLNRCTSAVFHELFKEADPR